MNFLQQITNPLINNDTNKVKVVVKRQIQNLFGSEGFYGRRFTFDVPREYNNLSGIWIKVAATTAAQTSIIQLYAADYHFKSMNLQTKNGLIITRSTDDYADSRSDELTYSTVNQSLANALQPANSKLTTTARSFFVPFYAFFSENREKSLPTKYMEPLEVVCETNLSKELMGLDQELTSCEYEAYFIYYDDVVPKPFTPVKMDVYDIYVEPKVTNTGGSTTLRSLLTCPYPVFCSHLSVREDTVSNYTNINNIKLSVAGNQILDVDERIIFDLFSDSESPSSIATNVGEIKHLYYGKQTGFKARTESDSFITFNGSMYPCNLELELSAGDTGDKLRVIHEYRYILEINDQGKVVKHNSDSLVFNKDYNSA